MITCSQLGIHGKPVGQVGLLNIDGYYDPLLALFEKGAAQGFIKPDCRQTIVSAPTGDEPLTKMEPNISMQHAYMLTSFWTLGEYGTMKLLEMITWSQLEIHGKPIGRFDLLNVDGYYDPLLALFEKGVAGGFIKPDCRQTIVSGWQ